MPAMQIESSGKVRADRVMALVPYFIQRLRQLVRRRNAMASGMEADRQRSRPIANRGFDGPAQG